MNRKLDEEKMWKMAEKRIAFKRHLFAYIVINIFLVGLWYFSNYKQGENAGFWFIYPLFGWGIGLAFNYWSAYHDDIGAVDKEYNKIKEKYGQEKENSDPIL
ncbi:MAG TPA: 2TM domain-containing protein [Chitinophagales bacterium]|nr:2TM domain-containing protein [Chitinophagales bacterium]